MYYSCDRCGAVKRFEGRLDGFDGSFLDDTWRYNYDFADLKAAWQRGDINVMWWCNSCQKKLLENNPAVIAERGWWNRYEKRWARGSWYHQWLGKSTAPAAARTKPQSDAGWAGHVAQASPDLRQVPQEELMMFPQFGAALAERFGAALA